MRRTRSVHWCHLALPCLPVCPLPDLGRLGGIRRKKGECREGGSLSAGGYRGCPPVFLLTFLGRVGGSNHAHVTATTPTPPIAHNAPVQGDAPATGPLSERLDELSHEEVDGEDEEEDAKRPAKAYLRQP